MLRNNQSQMKQPNTSYMTPERKEHLSKLPQNRAKTDLISRKKPSDDLADSSMSRSGNRHFSSSSKFNMSNSDSNSPNNFLSSARKNQNILEDSHLLQMSGKSTSGKQKNLSRHSEYDSTYSQNEPDHIESLQLQNKALKDSIRKKDDELLQLNQKLRKAVRHKKSHKIKKEIAEKELELIKNDNLQLQNDIEDKDNIILQLYSEIKSLNDSNGNDHNKLKRITELYRKNETNLGNQIKMLQDKITRIQNENDNNIKAMKKNIAALQSENDSLKIAITEYETIHHSLQEDKEDIKCQNNLLQEKYDKLKEKCQFSESESLNEIEDLKEQNAMLIRKNKELVAQNESLKEQLSSPNKSPYSRSRVSTLQEGIKDANEEEENEKINNSRFQTPTQRNSRSNYGSTSSASLREIESLKEANQKLKDELVKQQKSFEIENRKLQQQVQSLNGVSKMNDSLIYQLNELQAKNSRMRENSEHMNSTTFGSDTLLHDIQTLQNKPVQNVSNLNSSNNNNNENDISALNSMTNDSLVKEILKLRSQNETLKKEIDKINTQSMISNIEANSNSSIGKSNRISKINQSFDDPFDINENNNNNSKINDKFNSNYQTNNLNEEEDNEKNSSYSTFDEDSILHTIKKQQKESSNENTKTNFDRGNNDNHKKDNVSNIESYIEDESMVKIIQDNDELKAIAERIHQNSSSPRDTTKSFIEKEEKIFKNTEMNTEIKDDIEEEDILNNNDNNNIFDIEEEEESLEKNEFYHEEEELNNKEEKLLRKNFDESEEESENENNYDNLEKKLLNSNHLDMNDDERLQDDNDLNNNNNNEEEELLNINEFDNNGSDYLFNDNDLVENKEEEEKLIYNNHLDNDNEESFNEINFGIDIKEILNSNNSFDEEEGNDEVIDTNDFHHISFDGITNEKKTDDDNYDAEEDENENFNLINPNLEIEEEEENEHEIVFDVQKREIVTIDINKKFTQDFSDDLLHSESDNEQNNEGQNEIEFHTEKMNEEEEEEEDLKEEKLDLDNLSHSSSDSHSNHRQNDDNNNNTSKNMDFFRRPNINSNEKENLSEGEVPPNSNFDDNDDDENNLNQQLAQVCSENEQLKQQNSILHDEINDLQEHFQNLVSIQLHNTLDELDDVQKDSQELRQRSYNLELLQMENANLKDRVINLEAQNIDLRQIIIDNSAALSNNANSGNNSLLNSSFGRKSTENLNTSSNSIRKSPKNDYKSLSNADDEIINEDDDYNSMGILKEKTEQMRSVINTIRNASSASSTADEEKENDLGNDDDNKNSSDSLSISDYRTMKRENAELKEIINKFDINIKSNMNSNGDDTTDGYNNNQLIDKVQQLELTNAELIQRIEEISQNENQNVDRLEEENQGLRTRILHLENQLSEAVEAEAEAREIAIAARAAAIENSRSTANSSFSFNNSYDTNNNRIKSPLRIDLSPHLSNGLSPSQREEIQSVFEGFKSQISELQQSLSDIQKENSILENKMNEQIANASATELMLKQESENLKIENDVLRNTILSIQSSYSNQYETNDFDENELNDDEEDFGN